MTRAELIDALEVERFTIPPRPEVTARWHDDAPTPLTREQQAENRRRLAEAIGDDRHLWNVSAQAAG